MKGSDHVFGSIAALYYNLHKTNLYRSGSYTDSPEWLKNEQATINPKNKKKINIFNMP